MCGIAGFAGLSNESLLREMTDSLRHRGPDESGFFHQDGAGLGSRRLSIIDLKGGTQPIFGEKGDAVVFNGEIYNFQVLREELKKKGHIFKTRSDTEVIVHLYEDRGTEAFEELSGMFAIALWDAKARKLVLARDPLGVKPLYYAIVGDRLYFGSEIKALRKAPEVSSEINLAALDHYFSYLYIPAPHTIYRGVQKLMPGQWLTWQAGRIEKGTFWSPRVREAGWDIVEAAERLDGLLAKVVEDQKVSDVPIGLFLSGGLDSSAIAYYAVKSGARPEAFITYYSKGGEHFDERDKARTVARHLGLRLNELCVEPKVPEVMEEIVQAFDEPMADSSALPTYWISRLTRRSVKVALTGIGGDEIFGGYPRYLGAKLLEKYQRFPRGMREMFKLAAPLIPEQVSSRNVGSWLRRFLASGDMPPQQAYAQWMADLTRKDKSDLYSPSFRREGTLPNAPEAAFEGKSGDILQRILAVDVETYLPDDLLALADRTSMAASLEVRVPLCDQRLVELALQLPSDDRVRGLTLKYLLKKVLHGKLPAEILSQKKQGFMIPIGNWFKGDLEPFLKETVTAFARRGILRPEGLSKMVVQHLQGRRNRTDILWSFVLLEHWFRRYHPDFKLDGEGSSPSKARKVRVLVASDFIFPDSEGGSSRVAWESARRLKALGFEALTCTLGREEGLKAEETIDGLEVRRLWRRRFYKGMFLRPKFIHAIREELDGVLRDFEPDEVLAHHPLIAWLLQGHPRLKQTPFVYFYHSSWPEDFKADGAFGIRSVIGRWARRHLEAKVLARMKSIAVISDYMRGDVARRYPFTAGKVIRIPAGIDLGRFQLADKKSVRTSLQLTGDPVILTVRNLRPRMGLDILLEAAAILLPKFPKMELLIGGVGPLSQALQEQAQKLGLTDHVKFLGLISDSDLPQYYQAADLFALPSRELEGFGLVLLEALACGTPCVGTRVGGIPEVLGPLSSKLLADSVAPRGVADAIERGLASGISPAESRDYVASRYGWDRMAEALASLL